MGRARVSAVLRVETVDGEAVRFRVECVSLPRCEAGGRIRGRFALDLPDATQRLSDYADGIALSAEYQSGMLRLGPGRSFRARTARLQAAPEPRFARRHGRKHRRCSGCDGRRRQEPSFLRPPQRLPGRRTFPCAGGERPARHHLLWSSGRSAPPGAGAQPGLSAGKVSAPGRDGSPAGGHHRRDALGPPGSGGGLDQLPRGLAGGPADTITSLGAAGVLMCLGNGYAVCDVGFELSFAAVLGTLAGGTCAKRGRKAYYNKKKKQGRKPSRPCCSSAVWRAVCGMRSASPSAPRWRPSRCWCCGDERDGVWAVVSGVAVLWMVGPMLGLSLGAALLGLAAQSFGSLPLFEILRRPIAFCAEGLAFGMNEWAFRVSGLPGASLWFDGGYAALVCLVLFLLCAAAMRWNVRLRAGTSYGRFTDGAGLRP